VIAMLRADNKFVEKPDHYIFFRLLLFQRPIPKGTLLVNSVNK
jgi:hypothetical protein